MTSLLEKPAETNLRQIRRSRGITLDALAAAANVNRSYIGRIERKQETPSGAVTRRLSNALDVPAATLLDAPAATLLDAPAATLLDAPASAAEVI